MPPLVWIIIGAAGTGKTTVGRLLADRLDCDFIEGDRRHSASNVQKMAAGIPLSDADRVAWLNDLAGEASRASAAGREVVISCSALKRSYRMTLAAAGQVQFVLPVVAEAELWARLAGRSSHYMKREMLESQVRAFEMPGVDEDVWAVDGMMNLSAIVDEILQRANAKWPSMKLAWWGRG